MNREAQGLPVVRIFAFGKRGYHFAAANLAATLLHYAPTLRVEVRADAGSTYVPAAHRPGAWIDWEGPPNTRGDRPDPGAMKANILDHLPDGDSLVLDADTIALQDIRPLLKALQADGRPYITDVIGQGDGSQPIAYTPWATPEQIRAKLGRNGPATFYGLNTSWQFVRKVEGRGPAVLQHVAMQWHARTWTTQELKARWGASLPDELLVATACTALDYSPAWPHPVTFYGAQRLKLADVQSTYTLASLYGRGRGNHRAVQPAMVAQYDRHLAQVWKAAGVPYFTRLEVVTGDKHTN